MKTPDPYQSQSKFIINQSIHHNSIHWNCSRSHNIKGAAKDELLILTTFKQLHKTCDYCQFNMTGSVLSEHRVYSPGIKRFKSQYIYSEKGCFVY